MILYCYITLHNSLWPLQFGLCRCRKEKPSEYPFTSGTTCLSKELARQYMKAVGFLRLQQLLPLQSPDFPEREFCSFSMNTVRCEMNVCDRYEQIYHFFVMKAVLYWIDYGTGRFLKVHNTIKLGKQQKLQNS